jgi:hypothetical protein
MSMSIHAVSSTPDRIKAALESPSVRALGAELRRAGIELSGPISASAASKQLTEAGIGTERRIAIKATLDKVGLLNP